MYVIGIVIVILILLYWILGMKTKKVKAKAKKIGVKVDAKETEATVLLHIKQINGQTSEIWIYENGSFSLQNETSTKNDIGTMPEDLMELVLGMTKNVDGIIETSDYEIEILGNGVRGCSHDEADTVGRILDVLVPIA